MLLANWSRARAAYGAQTSPDKGGIFIRIVSRLHTIAYAAISRGISRDSMKASVRAASATTSLRTAASSGRRGTVCLQISLEPPDQPAQALLHDAMLIGAGGFGKIRRAVTTPFNNGVGSPPVNLTGGLSHASLRESV
jgi:hypothetical protein